MVADSYGNECCAIERAARCGTLVPAWQYTSMQACVDQLEIQFRPFEAPLHGWNFTDVLVKTNTAQFVAGVIPNTMA